MREPKANLIATRATSSRSIPSSQFTQVRWSSVSQCEGRAGRAARRNTEIFEARRHQSLADHTAPPGQEGALRSSSQTVVLGESTAAGEQQEQEPRASTAGGSEVRTTPTRGVGFKQDRFPPPREVPSEVEGP
jgi:hypothetical protein